jgi:DNA polymerase elongation subunit (family B)
MKFYTNVSRWGSHILYRGYNNGKRVTERVKFKPTMYLPSKHEKTIWTALDGTPVEPMKFDSMKDAKEFMAPYENLESFKIYGNTRYVAQFIQERFPDEIHFDRNVINVSTLDIEVMSNDGFPKPEDALHEIITITVKNSIDDVYYVWGTKPYDADKKLIHSQVEYRQFVDERTMMLDFVTWFAMPKNNPDIITGWNSRGFDIPYIVNRIISICGQGTVNLLSPFGKVEPKETVIKGRPMKIYEITGIAQLDYMDLFKKFTTHTYGNQESYKLGHIAHVVLGDGKLSYEEYGSLHNLYEENYQTFVDYNIKDVEIVDRLEDKLGLITLVLTLAYIGGVNYNDTLGTTAIWDSIIYRDLARKAIAIPPSVKNFKADYPGGYVKEPKVGLHNWVCSFDLNSLYPNLIIQYNMSPETITSETTPGISPDVILNDVPFEPHMPGTIMAANGVHFRTDKVGVIPRIITEIYDK